jgi:hypothetical protein
MNKNILEQANDILFNRSEEKTRQYGPFEEGMGRAAEIASILSSKQITTQYMYHCMVALKLSRQSYNHKEDNILDCITYLASLNQYLNNQK